jgi:PEP-CTERM motif-containing protein
MNPKTIRQGTRAISAMLTAFLIVATSVPSAQAQIVPTGAFGAQPAMTFGGTDIPNSWVMTNSNSGALGVLLGLTATQRYSNPAVTNDGAGTFFAPAGHDLTPGAGPNYAKWNFDWYFGGDNLFNYNYSLYYDFDPAAGNDVGDEGSTNPVGFAEFICAISGGEFCATPPYQDSYNLGMTFLTPPAAHPTFDPDAAGQYTFAIVASDLNGGEVARTAIQVDVGNASVTPEPATMSMMAFGLVGMAGMASRRRRRKA